MRLFVALAFTTALAAPRLRAQAAADPRFDALATLAEAKMKEYGVPGVALGIISRRRRDDARTRRHERRGSAARHRAHRLSDRVDLEDVRRDGDDAARRAGQDRSARAGAHLPARLSRARCGREPRGHRLASASRTSAAGRGKSSGPDRGTETLKDFVASTTVTDLMQVAPPGAAWSYNNAGFSIAGRVIEVVTGTADQSRDFAISSFSRSASSTRERLPGEFIVQRFAAGHIDAQRNADAATPVRAVVERHGGRRRSVHHRPADVRAVPHGRRHGGERRARADARVARRRCARRSCASRAPTTTSASRGICGTWARFAPRRTAAR